MIGIFKQSGTFALLHFLAFIIANIIDFGVEKC